MLSCQKDKFTLPEDVTYLNCAYRGPLMKHIEKIGHAALSANNEPFRLTASDFFEPVYKLQKLLAQLINCKDSDRIALIPSVSYGMANAANNIDFKNGDEIIMVSSQFPSNYFVWKRKADATGAVIKIIEQPSPVKGSRVAWNQLILASITSKTKVVTIGNLHWADGTIYDLEAIRKKTNEYDAYLVIDGTQSIGALPFDIQKVQADAVICAAYKWLFAPYGSGFAYYGPRFDQGIPIEESWMNRKDSHQFEKLLDYQSEYKPAAQRYMVGQSSNFIFVPMMTACIEQILDWGVENIQAYLKNIGSGVVEAVEEFGGSLEHSDQRSHHLFGIYLGNRIDKVKLRNAFTENKVIVSFRGEAIRVSPHLYNESKDFEKLVRCFKESWV